MMKHQEDEEHEEDKLQDEWRQEAHTSHVAPGGGRGETGEGATSGGQESVCV